MDLMDISLIAILITKMMKGVMVMKSTVNSVVIDRFGSQVATMRADGGANIFSSLDEYESESGTQVIPTQQICMSYEGVNNFIGMIIETAIKDGDNGRLSCILKNISNEQLAELLARRTYEFDSKGKLVLDEDGNAKRIDGNYGSITLPNIDRNMESLWIYGRKKFEEEENDGE